MPSRGHWVYDPDYSGKKILAIVQADVIRRINQVAQEHYKGRYTRIDIRFRGQFCYICAYTEPHFADDWPPSGWEETCEEAIERMRNTPTTCAAWAISEMMSGVLLFFL